MPDSPVSLYFASSFEQLLEKSEITIPKSTNPSRCKQILKQLTKKAIDARNKKDEEIQFMYLNKYLTYISYAVTNLRVSKKDTLWEREFITAQTHEKEFQSLMNKLKIRYKELYEKSKNDSLFITMYSPKVINDTTVNESKIRRVNIDIDCLELYKLVTADPPDSTFLIMDIRPVGDFEESHINHKNVLNVSHDKISPGMSAHILGKKFTDDESQDLWKMRGNVDKLILHDWFSFSEPIGNSDEALWYVRDVLLKWDVGITYKSNPLILDGGYEWLLSRYPQITTNAKVKPPMKSYKTNDYTISSICYPMKELEPEKENLPRIVFQPTKPVDRSSKPQILKDGKNNVLPKSKSPTIYEDMDSDVSVNSVSDEQSSQTVDSLNFLDEVFQSIEKNNSNCINGESVTKTPELVDRMKKPSVQNDTSQININSVQLNNIRTESPNVEPKPVGILKSSSSSTPDSKLIPSDSVHDQLKELRKSKPQTYKTRNQTMKGFKNRDIEFQEEPEGVFTSPLKRDGGSGGLKRSSSSPNLAQIKDDESVHVKLPTFSRSNKPNIRRMHPTYGERTDSTYGTTTSAGLTGLKNFANNCYMNSIVQCLNNTEELVEDVTALNKHRLNPNSRSKGRVAQEIIDAFRSMCSGQIRVYSLKELKTIMGNIKDIFKGTDHQDSNEFLIILLEHLHEDLIKPAEVSVLDGADVDSGEKAWGEFKRKNSSVIQRLFYGQHKSTVICGTCNHTSATFEQFFNLFVPIPSNQSAVTLNDCIQLYMSGERISGWKCPKCNAERNATKKFDISRLPPILIIALKRFTQEDDSWLQKKENIVSYPLENLDMSRFTVASSEQRYTKYNLYAMSTHSGTLKSGHYRAICKNYRDQRWYLFDDQIVECLSLQRVENNPEVYILFYNAVGKD